MRKIVFLFLFLGITSLKAQIKSEEFYSSALQDNRKLAIYLPSNYDKKQEYPLVVVLDAEYLLEPVIAGVRYFTYFKNMPESIIVGVYNNADDITIDKDYGLPDGQSLKFMNFLGGELPSYIKRDYNIGKLKIIIAEGKSANFINYYLLKEDSPFNAYISLNPDLIKSTNEPLARNLGETPSFVFYYMATTDLIYQEAYDISNELNTLIEQNKTDNLDYYFEDFRGASENSVALTGIPRAFDMIYKVYKPITIKEFREVVMKKDDKLFEYLTDKYAQIEDKLGVRKNLTINDIMAIYSAIRKKGDWISLKKMADLVKDGYKDTTMPEFFYGEYYERIGEPKKALKAYQRAYTKEGIDFITKDLIFERINKIKEDFGYK